MRTGCRPQRDRLALRRWRFYLTRGELTGNAYQLPGKSMDSFQLNEALPGYGGAFLGGSLLDILLWSTDYHHFAAPVSGTIIHHGQYEGATILTRTTRMRLNYRPKVIEFAGTNNWAGINDTFVIKTEQ